MIILPYQWLRFMYLDTCEWDRPRSAELARSFLNVTTLESRAKIWPVKLIVTPSVACFVIQCLGVLPSFVIISLRKREPVALL